MQGVLEDLRLKKLWIVHPGAGFSLKEKIELLPIVRTHDAVRLMS